MDWSYRQVVVALILGVHNSSSFLGGATVAPPSGDPVGHLGGESCYAVSFAEQATGVQAQEQ